MIATEEQWIDLLVGVLSNHSEVTSKAVTGAGLNSALLKKASEVGLESPINFRKKKFKSLLLRLAKDGRLLILPEGGSDVLVAPIDRPDFLADNEIGLRRGFPGIRRDLFNAFTWVGEKKPFYNPERDDVKWLPDGQNEDGLKAIPAPDFEKLKERAAGFAQELDGDLRVRALEALDHLKPMAAFSRFIASENLSKSWHEYRTSSIVSEIRKWAEANHIPFKSEWLTSSSDGGVIKSAASLGVVEGSEKWSQSSLQQVISSLSREEIARIHIPLDIVLRLYKDR